LDVTPLLLHKLRKQTPVQAVLRTRVAKARRPTLGRVAKARARVAKARERVAKARAFRFLSFFQEPEKYFCRLGSSVPVSLALSGVRPRGAQAAREPQGSLA